MNKFQRNFDKNTGFLFLAIQCPLQNGGIKPLSERMLTSWKVFWGIHMRAIVQDALINLTRKISSEITFSKLLSHLPGAIELTHLPLDQMAAISQMTCSNAFPWMESSAFD